MSILGDIRLVPKKSADILYIQQYIDATTDHITPCSRMRARGKKQPFASKFNCSAHFCVYTVSSTAAQQIRINVCGCQGRGYRPTFRVSSVLNQLGRHACSLASRSAMSCSQPAHMVSCSVHVSSQDSSSLMVQTPQPPTI